MKNTSRRSFIVSGIVGLSSVTGSLPVFISKSFAGEKHSMVIKPLADGGPSLESFSISYNPNLRDKGALNLATALPSSVTEIGLVGCGVGDVGGKALVASTATTPKLHWLCIEQNNFTKETKASLVSLGRERRGLLVVV